VELNDFETHFWTEVMFEDFKRFLEFEFLTDFGILNFLTNFENLNFDWIQGSENMKLLHSLTPLFNQFKRV